MPSPFSKKPQLSDSVDVTNSTLVCDQCYDSTEYGTYWPEKKLLVFMCPNGHKNEVRNIVL